LNYKWILFDADETLFHFDAYAGLQAMFSEFGVAFSQEDFTQYQATNQPLWHAFQLGQINAEQLQHRRFAQWGSKLDIAPATLNSRFLQSMANITQLIEGVAPLLSALKGQAQLGIITNGFEALQSVRLAKLGLTDTFKIVVSSEQAGVAKPDIGIFNYTLNLMGDVAKEEVLMVGDNFVPDVIGGQKAGFDTCWYNPKQLAIPQEPAPTFNISNMAQLIEILNLKS
jgi:YjjG family noncanonical pyrimidine nucleotidase